MKKNKQNAFSLIEAIVCIIVLSLLLALFAPVLVKNLTTGTKSAALKNIFSPNFVTYTLEVCEKLHGIGCKECNKDECSDCIDGYALLDNPSSNNNSCARYEEIIPGCVEYDKDNEICTKSAAGYKLNGDKPELCPIGTYSEAGATECIPCGNDTYNNKAGQASCIACPYGTYYNSNDSESSGSSCTPCSSNSDFGEKCISCNYQACTVCDKGGILKGKKCVSNIPILAEGDTWYTAAKDEDGETIAIDDLPSKDSIIKIQIYDSFSKTDTCVKKWIANKDYRDSEENANKAIKVCLLNNNTLIIYGNGSGKIQANANSANAFSGFSSVKSIEFNDIFLIPTDDGEVDMTSMFERTGYNSTTFEISGIENWNVSNVTNMKNMFFETGYAAQEFKMNVGDWQTEEPESKGTLQNVTDMSNMFKNTGYSAKNWKIGDLDGWNVSNVTNMSSMFENAGRSASEWNIGDISKWNVSNVTNFSWMFTRAGYSATKEFNMGTLSDWIFTNKAISSIGYIGCDPTVDSSCSKGINMEYMFYGVAAGYPKNFALNLAKWDVSKVANMRNMFAWAARNSENWSIGNISNWKVLNVTNMPGMFAGAGEKSNEFILDLADWNVSKVTNMTSMFENTGSYATRWEIGDISKWNVSNVTTMYAMFNEAGQSVQDFNLNLSGWNAPNVTTMNNMFSNAGYNATNVTINLSGWAAENVTDLAYMFSNAGYNATNVEIDLSNCRAQNVTNLDYMFSNAGYNATNVTINLNNWASRVSNVTHAPNMFNRAGHNVKEEFNIIGIDGAWKFSALTSAGGMFYGTGTAWVKNNGNVGKYDLSNWIVNIAKPSGIDTIYTGTVATDPLSNTRSIITGLPAKWR